MHVFRVVDINLENDHDLEALLFSQNASNGQITRLRAAKKGVQAWIL